MRDSLTEVSRSGISRVVEFLLNTIIDQTTKTPVYIENNWGTKMKHNAITTDLYQLTMAYAYWKRNIHETNSVFHLFFRKAPFGGEYALVAGLQTALDYLKHFRFKPKHLKYLASLRTPNKAPLFEKDFLTYLGNLRFTCAVHAMLEGTVAFPNEPILKVTGPIIQAQLVETALLNIINFQTLIATKAARVKAAAGDDLVAEFGLRRAQGIDGGLSASRAAYIGGCSSTSNVSAGYQFGIPVVGTHAHSWVMSFDDEHSAFDAYAEAMPDNVVLLVDTYNTIEGIRNAIKTGQKLLERGHNLNGIRLDSGNLCELSITARQMLDDAGFTETKIIASNDLDEYKITLLKAAGAKVDIWGVGTNLVTAQDQPALGGVYKLGSIETESGWVGKVKQSEDSEKTTNPGNLQVYRRYVSETPVEDLVQDESESSESSDPTAIPLLYKVMMNGKSYFKANIHDVRLRAMRQINLFSTIKNYPVTVSDYVRLAKSSAILHHKG